MPRTVRYFRETTEHHFFVFPFFHIFFITSNPENSTITRKNSTVPYGTPNNVMLLYVTTGTSL